MRRIGVKFYRGPNQFVTMNCLLIRSLTWIGRPTIGERLSSRRAKVVLPTVSAMLRTTRRDRSRSRSRRLSAAGKLATGHYDADFQQPPTGCEVRTNFVMLKWDKAKGTYEMQRRHITLKRRLPREGDMRRISLSDPNNPMVTELKPMESANRDNLEVEWDTLGARQGTYSLPSSRVLAPN